MKKDKNALMKIVTDILYYELRYEALKLPCVTVCLLLNPSTRNLIARGISIRSLMDPFIRKKGKNKSYGRALKAAIRMKSNLPIHPERFRMDDFESGNEVIDYNIPLRIAQEEVGDYKSAYFPMATIHERRLIDLFYMRKENHEKGIKKEVDG